MMDEQEYNNSIIGPLQFSMAISKIAQDKCHNKYAKEFAGFEMAETLTLTTILKELGTLLLPGTDESFASSFAEVEVMQPGVEFDWHYISLELENHKKLRDLTEDYLTDAPAANLDKVEAESKHLAMLILMSLNEHISITEKILQATGGKTK